MNARSGSKEKLFNKEISLEEEEKEGDERHRSQAPPETKCCQPCTDFLCMNAKLFPGERRHSLGVYLVLAGASSIVIMRYLDRASQYTQFIQIIGISLLPLFVIIYLAEFFILACCCFSKKFIDTKREEGAEKHPCARFLKI